MENGFLLCILSPVWRAKLCGEFGNTSTQILKLEEKDETVFSQILALGCGDMVRVVGGLQAIVGLGMMADRYQVETVQDAIEHAVLSQLTVETCASILSMGCESGLERLECAGRALALSDFDAFALSAGFIELSEELLGSLLDDDALQSESEERVFEMLVRWMSRGGTQASGAVRGMGLLHKIRFPFMTATSLENIVKEQLAIHGLDALSTKVLALKRPDLEATTQTPRQADGQVCWGVCVEGGEFRLPVGQRAACISPHGSSLVCVGMLDGSIRVWSRYTLQAKTTLIGHTQSVWALISLGEMLISGSVDCDIRVWNMAWVASAAGPCMRVLKGHTGRVSCLAVSGCRLVSGSWDGTARVWRMEGQASQWRCELILSDHECGMNCLATWGGKLASGSTSKSILVWDLATGVPEQELVGHTGSVAAMVASGQRLISSSVDRTVRVWSMLTWSCVQTVQVYDAGSVQRITGLAVSGSTLIGSSDGLSSLEEYEVRVWDLDTLEPLHTLKQPAGRSVDGLVVDRGEVWVTCGKEVVVWGWRGQYREVGPWPQWVAKLGISLQCLFEWLWLKITGDEY